MLKTEKISTPIDNSSLNNGKSPTYGKTIKFINSLVEKKESESNPPDEINHLTLTEIIYDLETKSEQNQDMDNQNPINIPLSQEMSFYINFSTTESYQFRQKIVDYINELLKHINSNYVAVLFGSSATQMYCSNDADVDIAIIRDPSVYHCEAKEQVKTYRSLLRALHEHPTMKVVDIVAQYNLITLNLNVFNMILNSTDSDDEMHETLNSCNTLPELLEVDLILSTDHAPSKTHLINDFSSLSPHLIPLCRAVKDWAKARNLLGAQGRFFNSFSLNLMCINFLQQKGLLPVLASSLPSQERETDSNTCNMGSFTESPYYDDFQSLKSSDDAVITKKNDLNLESVLNQEYQEFHPECYTPLILKKGFVKDAIDKIHEQKENNDPELYIYTSSITPAMLTHYMDRNSNYQLGDILIDFFNFYGYLFDHRIHAVNVRVGHCTFNQEQLLGLSKSSSLIIEDPLSPEDNTARALKYYRSAVIEFKRVANLLKARKTWNECIKPFANSVETVLTYINHLSGNVDTGDDIHDDIQFDPAIQDKLNCIEDRIQLLKQQKDEFFSARKKEKTAKSEPSPKPVNKKASVPEQSSQDKKQTSNNTSNVTRTVHTTSSNTTPKDTSTQKVSSKTGKKVSKESNQETPKTDQSTPDDFEEMLKLLYLN